MSKADHNTLTAFFADEGDMRHDLEFVILDSGPIEPGTRIVAGHAGAQGSYLEVVSCEGQSIWVAEWRDITGRSPRDGALFRLILTPPVEYEDDLPVRRQFRVEMIGDHELSGPRFS